MSDPQPGKHPELEECMENAVADPSQRVRRPPPALKITPTCAAVIRYYAGDRNASGGMRLDVFQKATTRCIRAGWLKDTDEWPYTGVTPEGLREVGLSA